nr:glycosyltransferase [Leptospira kirschneri]
MLFYFLNQENPQIVFVDSYLADIQIYETINKKTQKLICIDDTNRIPYPEKSIILNPGLGGQCINYDGTKNTVLTGIEYVLLRKPYRENFIFPNVREKVESILVTLGGSDQLNLVPKILEVLIKIKPEWKKEIVVGSSFQNIKEIKSITDRNTKLHLRMSASEMRDLMLSVDLAVTAGGQTTYELAKCAVPMIIIKTADNQLGNLNGLRNKNIINNYLDSEADEFKNKLRKEILSLTSFQLRQQMSQVLLLNFVAQSNQVFDFILS